MDESVLISYLRGKSTPEESIRVESWYQSSDEHKKTLEQLYYVLFIGDRAEAMQNVDTENALLLLKQRIAEKENRPMTLGQTSRPKRRWAWAAAAFLAGLIVSGTLGLLWLSQQTVNYTLLTNAGQRAQTVLPDGSKVWLNGSTRLVYRQSAWPSSRRVDLTGEAYFEVATDKNVPFVVNSKNIKTCVLGTKFNIRAREHEDRVVATLLKGSVRVDLPLGENSGYLLKPGQTLNIDTHNYNAQIIEYDKPAEVLTWISGVLSFNQYTLQQITDMLEKIYDVQFIYDDTRLKEERFTGRFSTDNTPEEILTVLSYTNHLKFTKKGTVIHLFRK